MFYLAKYGTQTVISFPMIKRGLVDFATSSDWTPATGDTKISKDQGNVGNTGSNPAATGGTGSTLWNLTISATELQCAEATIQIVDSATKAVEDQCLIVYTFGHASAKIPLDLSDLVRAGLTALPNANAAASGGLPTVDANNIVKANLKQIDELATNANSATLNLKQLNIVNSAGDALVASSTGSNGSGIKASGNGSGNGIQSNGGASGAGLKALGGASAGAGIEATGQQTGAEGIAATGGTDGDGLVGYGTGSGNGIAGIGGVTGKAVNAEFVQAIWDILTSALTTAGSIGKLIVDNLNAAVGTVGTNVSTLLTRLGTPSDLGSGATVAGNLVDIEGQTDDIGAAGAGLTAIPDSAGVTTLLSRIPAALFSGITSLAQWLGLIAGKQTGNSTARTEIRATGAGGGTFDETTDSQEAIRDNQGAAQTGDAYAIVNSGTFGNAALKTLIDDLPTNSELATALAAADDAVLAAIAALNNLAAGAAMTLTAGERLAIADAMRARVLTEGYAADGAAPTQEQILFMIYALLANFSFTGTVQTVNKLDKTTTAMTFNIDDQTTPTSHERAT